MHWCPECRGDLTADERASIRAVWFKELAKSKSVEEVYARWLQQPEKIPVTSNLRRENKQSWIPPKIRKREAGDKAIQQRAAAAAQAAQVATAGV
jgi:hypothetical protein